MTMTAKTAAHMLNSYATIDMNGVRINVEIVDVKRSYGNERFLITPISGNGEVWVDSGRCKLVTASEVGR
jgi:hypothetical protein